MAISAVVKAHRATVDATRQAVERWRGELKPTASAFAARVETIAAVWRQQQAADDRTSLDDLRGRAAAQVNREYLDSARAMREAVAAQLATVRRQTATVQTTMRDRALPEVETTGLLLREQRATRVQQLYLTSPLADVCGALEAAERSGDAERAVALEELLTHRLSTAPAAESPQDLTARKDIRARLGAVRDARLSAEDRTALQEADATLAATAAEFERLTWLAQAQAERGDMTRTVVGA